MRPERNRMRGLLFCSTEKQTIYLTVSSVTCLFRDAKQVGTSCHFYCRSCVRLDQSNEDFKQVPLCFQSFDGKLFTIPHDSFMVRDLPIMRVNLIR